MRAPKYPVKTKDKRDGNDYHGEKEYKTDGDAEQKESPRLRIIELPS
jgi:hypothetical protein